MSQAIENKPVLASGQVGKANHSDPIASNSQSIENVEEKEGRSEAGTALAIYTYPVECPPSPAKSGAREPKSRSAARLASSRKTQRGGARNRADRISDSLSRQQVSNIIEAADFAIRFRHSRHRLSRTLCAPWQ